MSSLKNHISLIWHLFWVQFGAFIEIWVMNPTKLSLHQLDFCSSRYPSWNGRRSTLADCEIWLWRLRFPCSSLFYSLALDVQKGLDVRFLMPLESLIKTQTNRFTWFPKTEYFHRGSRLYIIGGMIQILNPTQYNPSKPVFHSYTRCFSQICTFSLSQLHFLYSSHTCFLLCLHL